MNASELNDFLYQKAKEIGEHFDAVQIIATLKDEDGDTQNHSCGSGNFYARIGSAREWLLQEEERARVHIRRKDREAPGSSAGLD